MMQSVTSLRQIVSLSKSHSLQQKSSLFYMPCRQFRRNANPSFYNQRFTSSNGLDNNYVHYVAPIHAAEGTAPAQTQRDPNKFKYSTNLWKNDYWEWRMRAGDYMY